MTDLDAYLNEIVDPTIAEFKERQSSKRRGFIACVCLYHAVDYFSEPPSKENRRRQFRAASADFLAIDRVAHAFKHQSTGNDRGPIRPLQSKHVRERPPAIFGQMILGASVFGDGSGGVMVGGETDDLFQIVLRARDFVEEERCKKL